MRDQCWIDFKSQIYLTCSVDKTGFRAGGVAANEKWVSALTLDYFIFLSLYFPKVQTRSLPEKLRCWTDSRCISYCWAWLCWCWAWPLTPLLLAWLCMLCPWTVMEEKQWAPFSLFNFFFRVLKTKISPLSAVPNYTFLLSHFSRVLRFS